MSNFLRSSLRGQIAVIGTLLLAVLATSSVVTQGTMAVVEQVEERILKQDRNRVAKKPKSSKESKSSKKPKSSKKSKSPKGGKSTKTSKKGKKEKSPKTSSPSTITEREKKFDTTNVEGTKFSGPKTKKGSPIENAFDNDALTAALIKKLPGTVTVTYPAGLSFINEDYMLNFSEKGPLPTSWTVEGLTSSGWVELDTVLAFDWEDKRKNKFKLSDKGPTSSIRIKFGASTVGGRVKKRYSLAIAEINVNGLFATNSPTKSPTSSPTDSPSMLPTTTSSPTDSPTMLPTDSPSMVPTTTPTLGPTHRPSLGPTPNSTGTEGLWPAFRRNMLEESHTLLEKGVTCESDETHHEHETFHHFTVEYVRRLLWPASVIANIFQSEDRGVGNEKIAMSLNDDDIYSPVIINHQIVTANEQRQFLSVNGQKCYPSGDDDTVLNKFDMFKAENEAQFSTELWKYCALAVEGGAYIDSNSPLVESFVQTFSVGNNLELGPFGGVNYAVLGLNAHGTIHGSAIVFDSPMSPVALSMVAFLVETNVEVFKYSSLAVPKALYNFISADIEKDPSSLELKSGLNEGQISKWMMLNHYCDVSDEMNTESMCPETAQFCCKIIDPCEGSTVMVTNSVVLPAYME